MSAHLAAKRVAMIFHHYLFQSYYSASHAKEADEVDKRSSSKDDKLSYREARWSLQSLRQMFWKHVPLLLNLYLVR
jgi:hypothetical protein